jgi:hypothetical protein
MDRWSGGRTQEGLGTETGRERHRMEMGGEKSWMRPRYTRVCSAKEEEEEEKEEEDDLYHKSPLNNFHNSTS